MKWNWAISEKRIFGITGHMARSIRALPETSICYIGRNFASFFSFLYFFFFQQMCCIVPRVSDQTEVAFTT